MVKVGIVTDSVGCVPPEKVREYGIRIVPLALNINGKSYRDQVDLSPDQFWGMFKSIKQFGTGAPAMGEFTSVFADLGKSTNDIVCVLVSKDLSATCEAATQAREIAKKENPKLNIEIIDSRTAAGAEGFMALEVARAAQAGKSMAELVKVAQDMLPRVKYVVAMETLKYLIKGGRAPKTAYMGELFQVKPLIGMVTSTGLVENLGRVRGKEKAWARLLDLVGEHADASKPMHVNVHYTDSLEDGKELLKRVTARYSCVETYLTPYTPVMAGHTGPIVAVSFYS